VIDIASFYYNKERDRALRRQLPYDPKLLYHLSNAALYRFWQNPNIDISYSLRMKFNLERKLADKSKSDYNDEDPYAYKKASPEEMAERQKLFSLAYRELRDYLSEVKVRKKDRR
jgi:hypothetical protein